MATVALIGHDGEVTVCAGAIVEAARVSRHAEAAARGIDIALEVTINWLVGLRRIRFVRFTDRRIAAVAWVEQLGNPVRSILVLAPHNADAYTVPA